MISEVPRFSHLQNGQRLLIMLELFQELQKTSLKKKTINILNS